MNQRTCVICSTDISELDLRSRVCSDECHKIRARRRASAWYAEHKDEPKVKAIRSAATKRSHLKRESDPIRQAAHLAYLANWRVEKRHIALAAEQAWRAAHPERAMEKVRRRRARLLGAWVEDVDVAELWERDGGICQLCGAPVDGDAKWPAPLSLTVDHILPLSKGGKHELANVQIAHSRCNSVKGDRIAPAASAAI